MILKVVSTICGILIICYGLLTKLSYNPVDQRTGNFLIAAAIAGLLVSHIASGVIAKIAQSALILPPIFLVGYIVFRRMQ